MGFNNERKTHKLWGYTFKWKLSKFSSQNNIFFLIPTQYKKLWQFLQDVFQAYGSLTNVGFLLHQYHFTVLMGCFILLWLKWAMPNHLYQHNSCSSNDFALLVVMVERVGGACHGFGKNGTYWTCPKFIEHVPD